MRARTRRAATAALAAAILVFGGGTAHATALRTELGCTTGGFLAFWDAEPCPGEDDPAGAADDPSGTDPGATAPPASGEPGTAEPGAADPGATPGTTAPTTPSESGSAGGATPPAAPVPDAPADPAGMVFTAHPATLTASTLAIGGLHAIEVVTVDLADGTTARALKITADRVVIDGFGLDVPTGDGGLGTTATTLTVDGHVTIWTPSITAILEDGVEHVIDTLSAPDPAALGRLAQLRLPLLGLVADSVAYTGTDQSTYTG
ncbi:hypothetical protein ACGGZK_09990 [Agromyces sp. MMS24-K17]|uniref:hypothetical protein n=1 Tax=Agromyces sp. MMS24-K17 TaxID=3372850 RepID=UPI003754694D